MTAERIAPRKGISRSAQIAALLSRLRCKWRTRRSHDVIHATQVHCLSTCVEGDVSSVLFDRVVLPVSLVGKMATCSETIRSTLPVISGLQPDNYTEYTARFYEAGLERYGDRWQYADITTALFAAATLVHPRRYLEIGVRQGRSMAVVAAAAPSCEIVGFDLWIENYGDAPNPGPNLVRDQLRKSGFGGNVTFISGNSHHTLPAYFREHPDIAFDLITVDGDHSREGAMKDLREVLPHLAIGGVLIFDDIVHPLHPYLRDVWDECVTRYPHYACWLYDELGYGVAIAIRRW